MATIIDSYSETNQSAIPRYTYLGGTQQYWGQSFTNAHSALLTNCKFYLYKTGSPTGNIYAKIYTHSGTYGTDGKPTGSVLATSDAFDVSTLPASFQLIDFTFSGANQITLTPSTYYVLVLDCSVGGVDGYAHIGVDSSPSHSGNYSYSADGTEWTAGDTTDTCFYVYGSIVGPFPTFFKQ